MKIIALFLIPIALVLACRIVPPANLPTGEDAGAVDRAKVVCTHLRTLGCSEGRSFPLPDGGAESCETLYVRVSGQLDGACVATAETPDALHDCNPPVECAP